MRPTTLSKFEITVLQPLVNLGIVTENAANHGVGAIVAAAEHVNPLIVQRGMMRANHKIICALDFQNRYFGLEKLTRLAVNPSGADGYEVMLSANRTSIELLNEIRVLTSFIRGNNIRAEIRWVLNLSKRTEAEASEILKHFGQHPPTAIRLEGRALPDITPAGIYGALTMIRKHSNAPIKVDANSPNAHDLIKALSGHKDIKAFDILDSKLLETSKFIQTLTALPAAKKPVSQFTTEDFEIIVTNLQKDPLVITAEHLVEYVSRCKVLGPQASKHLLYLEDLLMIKKLENSPNVSA